MTEDEARQEIAEVVAELGKTMSQDEIDSLAADLIPLVMRRKKLHRFLDDRYANGINVPSGRMSLKEKRRFVLAAHERKAYEPPVARDATPQEQTLLDRLTRFETTARTLTDKTCTIHFVSGRSCVYYAEKGHDVEPCPACNLRLMAKEGR